MSVTLTPEEYRDLIMASLPGASDADTIDPDLRILFTPDGHRLALEPDATVVQGARGVGKTVWFKVLQDPILRTVASQAYQLPRLGRVTPHTCFGARLDPDHFPGPAVLESLLDSTPDPLHIWRAVLAVALGVEEARALSGWRNRLEWVRANPEALDHVLATVDRQASADGVTHLFLFDALDRLHTDRAKADRLVSGILRLALDLRTGTRQLRAKVFIRHDMFGSSQLNFPDSSKLLANATSLTWTTPNLYGLLFHYLGNGDGAVASRFRESVGQWRRDAPAAGEERDVAHRYVSPVGISGDRETQSNLFVKIAGPHMGTNHRKGHTYTWLPNHLMDGLDQVSPRSFLRALSKAVEVTRESYASYGFALHYEGIRRGVQDASKIRVQEVAEDLPWVSTAVGDLSGTQVPTELESIVRRWTEKSLGKRLATELAAIDLSQNEDEVRTGPKDPYDYPTLVGELCDLGIMTRRSDGRVDLPDVYRIAFGIGRRGGVPRIKQ